MPRSITPPTLDVSTTGRRGRNLLTCLLVVSLAWAAPITAAPTALHHDLQVTLDPDRHHLKAVDRITLPDTDEPAAAPKARELTFTLHPDLRPTADNARLTRLGESRHGPGQRYRAELPASERTLTLRYQGRIHQPLQAYGKERARGFRATSGIVAPEGVYLAGHSGWYPEIEGVDTLGFKLTVDLPPHWHSVSQGRRLEQTDTVQRRREVWETEHPQQEIYLMAASFHEYQRPAGEVLAQVFLRAPDPALAERYLQATVRYLAMYKQLIGPYPYAKFALVENFWETGYGMPSFTLLGPRVIRLPFILTSSYPHEILHNWWGNGVYVDYETGNWCEGLTAYLADHLLKEIGGGGAEYRMQALQKYADYAASGRDFPLERFRARHSSATEAVGYGKSLMLFHMLRLDLGDETFTEALRDFYREHRFTAASFDDLRVSMERSSGRSLGDLFEQWVSRTGAPALKVENARVESGADGHRVDFELIQTQPGAAYRLQVPLALTLAGREQALETQVEMTDKRQSFQIALPAEPLRMDVDPAFDLFRRLDRAEMPPAFTELFGSRDLLIVLPASADAEMAAAYRTLAATLAQTGPERVATVRDDQLDALPSDRAVVALGWENRWLPALGEAFAPAGVGFGAARTDLAGHPVARADHALALVTRRDATAPPLALIAADRADALPGLGRKLPHYHKYSYLAFAGGEPNNTLKGRWAVRHSPMTVMFQPDTPRAALGERDPLAMPPPTNAQRMPGTIGLAANPTL